MAAAKRKDSIKEIIKQPHLKHSEKDLQRQQGHPPLDSDKDLIEFGKTMLREIEKHPDWWFIQDFASYAKMSSKALYNHADRNCFKEYYARAREILGLRLVRVTGKVDEKGRLCGLHPQLAPRFISTYFHDVKATEKELKREVADQLKEVVNVVYKGKMDGAGKSKSNDVSK